MPKLGTITIRGKQYKKPAMDRLKRNQVKRLPDLLKRIQESQASNDEIDMLQAVDALWEFVAIILPDIPEETLEDLELGECQTILTQTGFLPDAQATAGADDAEIADAEEITLGES